MKHFIFTAITTVAIVFAFGACNEEHIKYDGFPYTMFSDTLYTCPVLEGNKEFPIHIAAFKACDYDRVYAVEIIAAKSNAVYNEHFTLDNNTVTIKSGETSAIIKVQPIYENIEFKDNLKFELRLVSQFNDEWSEEGSSAKVMLRKVCPFDIENFTGYCRITSSFLRTYTNSTNRIFKCEKVEGEENTILMKDVISDGYNIKVKFDQTDPLKPTMKMIEEQVIGDTREIFGALYGDNRLLAIDAPGYASTFNSCTEEATQYMFVYIENVGTVNVFVNTFKWLADHEVE